MKTESPKTMERCVFFFTPRIDINNSLFGHSIEWVRELGLQADVVYVYAIHLGALPTFENQNIRLVEIGGGNLGNRIKAIGMLVKVLICILWTRSKSKLVIYHMIKEPAIILGPILKLLKVRQALWYSHSATTKSLRIATYWVDEVYTPTRVSFPIKSDKVTVTGHGVNAREFAIKEIGVRQQESILSVGRISRVKNFEKIIMAISGTSLNLEIIGPILDNAYQKELLGSASNLGVSLKFWGEIPYEEMPSVFNRTTIYYMGSPKTLDKAAVQAAMCGCFVVSDEIEALESLGMGDFWRRLGFSNIPNLEVQVKEILKLPIIDISRQQELVSVDSKIHNSLDTLISRILGGA